MATEGTGRVARNLPVPVWDLTRQKDFLVVPRALPFHNESVNCVGCESGHHLQDVGRGSGGTWVRRFVSCIGMQTLPTRRFGRGFLDEDVTLARVP